MKLRCRLVFTYEAEKEAEAVVRAVSPDNVKAPPGVSVETLKRNHCLIASIHCDKTLETFTATIDDLVSCVAVAEHTFESLRK